MLSHIYYHRIFLSQGFMYSRLALSSSIEAKMTLKFRSSQFFPCLLEIQSNTTTSGFTTNTTSGCWGSN